MYKIHKIEDGDIIKIFPIVGPNGKVSLCREYHFVYDGHEIICDGTNENYLTRIGWHIHKKSGKPSKYPISKRYIFNCYYNGEIEMLFVGKTLFDTIIREKDLFNIRKDLHLFIKKRIKNGYSSFEDSYHKNHNWDIPVSDPNSEEQWTQYIINNQPSINEYLEKEGIFNKIPQLKKLFGNDILSEIISEDRERKLLKLID